LKSWRAVRGKQGRFNVLIFARIRSNVIRLSREDLYDLTPLPDSIPKVKEIGASSAPLMSAAFFIGARCRPFNDDYMKCKEDAHGRGELDCMREGRKVTRCARSVYVH
jgi:NADH dehydrogenase (ubiquinone) 1 alpha subcomplex subunit 8